MKTIEINLYSFDELSEDAKKKALDKWNEGQDYFWSHDALKSLEKFAEHFYSELKDYSIDWCYANGSYAKFNIPDSEWTAKELKERILAMGTYNKKTLRGDGECKFTGYCADEDCADGARKAYFEGERDINAILQAGFETWIKSAVSDFEAQQTAEYFSDHADANGYTFEANGKMRNA